MATSLLLLHYNNYFNRTIKKLESLSEYQQADQNSAGCNNINFNPGDGINTSLILGYGTNPSAMFNDGANYDYLVVFDSDNENYPILSRWFIQEIDRKRGGQYELILRRDVIADNYEAVLDATTYIEKGQVSAGNNFIFNKEGMLFNQIKQSEEQLKDASGCAWLVGYIAKNANATNVTINYDPADQNVIKVSASNIDNWFQSLGINAGQPFLADPYDISYRTAWQAGTDFVYHYACRTYIYGTGSFSSEDDNRWVGNDAIRAG